MKKLLFAFVAGCIPALAVTNGACAQNPGSMAVLESSKHVFKIDMSVFTEKGNTVNLDAINARAVKDFKKSYRTVNDEKWTEVPGGFMALFTSNGISNRIFYNKKGQWAGSLKGYGEDKFNRDVRAIVKREYFDYKIDYVQEIETIDTGGIPTYLVHLEDENNIKLVRVSDGEMDVYQEFEKQK